MRKPKAILARASTRGGVAGFTNWMSGTHGSLRDSRILGQSSFALTKLRETKSDAASSSVIALRTRTNLLHLGHKFASSGSTQPHAQQYISRTSDHSSRNGIFPLFCLTRQEQRIRQSPLAHATPPIRAPPASSRAISRAISRAPRRRAPGETGGWPDFPVPIASPATV